MTGCSLPTPVLKTVHSSNPWGWHWGERGFLLFTCKYKMSIMSNILQLAFYLKHLLLLKNQMFTWNKKLDLSAVNGHLKVTTEIWCKSGMSILHFNCHLKCHSHRILQARTLDWVAMPSCRGSSQPRDQTQISCTAGGFFTVWATKEAQPKPTGT